MPISERPEIPPTPGVMRATVPTAVVAREAIFAAILVTGLAVLLAPLDLGASVKPYPGWAVVMVLSARYGNRGFAFSFFSLCGALTLTAACMGRGLGPLATAADSPVDVAALGLGVLVAWIASAHERRVADLAACREEQTRREVENAAVIRKLKDAAVELRARADRLDHSVTFMREVATRLEGDDAVAGAQAALELAIARTGARAGTVQMRDDRHHLRTVASAGPWALDRATAPDVALDRTVEAACAKAAPVAITEVERPGRLDSDVAAPILDHEGDVIGVLALRGVPPDSLRHALVHDLGLIALWCGHSSAQTYRVRRDAPGDGRRANVLPVASRTQKLLALNDNETAQGQ